MKTIIITDTHFGTRNNSKVWCDYQIKFIDNTLLPLVKKLSQKDAVRVVHCGDLFDSKSTLNTYIVDKVMKKIDEIAGNCPLYLVAGNHDFYSMTDDSICTIDLLFRNPPENINYVRRGFMADKERKELMLPYFVTEEPGEVRKVMDGLGFVPEVIYCHTDLERLNPEIRGLFKGSNVISGHIHIPCIHGNFYTIGSAYALNFGDSNTPHGCYVMDDNDVRGMQFIENNDSIKFWRLFDKDIFDDEIISKFRPEDYIEMYINKSNLLDDQYLTHLSSIRKRYRNSLTIPNDVTTERTGSAPIDFNDYNLERIIEEKIPEHLRNKFQIIKERIKDISL